MGNKKQIIFVLYLDKLIELVNNNYKYYHDNMIPNRDTMLFPIGEKFDHEVLNPDALLEEKRFMAVRLKFDKIPASREDFNTEIIRETYDQIKKIRQQLEENESLYVDSEKVTDVYVRRREGSFIRTTGTQ